MTSPSQTQLSHSDVSELLRTREALSRTIEQYLMGRRPYEPHHLGGYTIESYTRRGAVGLNGYFGGAVADYRGAEKPPQMIYGTRYSDTITLGDNPEKVERIVIGGLGGDRITVGEGKHVIVSGEGKLYGRSLGVHSVDHITAGNGDNLVVVSAGGNARVQLGNGNNGLNLAGVAKAVLGNGNNGVVVEHDKAGSDIRLGDGKNEVVFRRAGIWAGANGTTVKAGSGGNRVTFETNSHDNRVELATGGADDIVAVIDETGKKNTVVNFRPEEGDRVLVSGLYGKDMAALAGDPVALLKRLNITLENVDVSSLTATVGRIGKYYQDGVVISAKPNAEAQR